MKGINESFADKESWKKSLKENVQIVLGENHTGEIDEIDRRLEELQNQLMKLVVGNVSYDDVAEEIHTLRDKKLQLISEDSMRENEQKRTDALLDFIENQVTELNDYDEKLVRRVVDDVTVYNDRLVVRLKSGAEIEVKNE